jgi:hypothetical protein
MQETVAPSARGGRLSPETVISIVALLVAVVSFALPFWHTWRSHKAEIRPILVFLYDTERGWHIRNVGGGPALNVLVARRQPPEEWRSPVRVPPVSNSDSFQLKWMKHTNIDQLGASYEDFEGRAYSSICRKDLAAVEERNVLPTFTPEVIRAHWQMPETDNQ